MVLIWRAACRNLLPHTCIPIKMLAPMHSPFKTGSSEWKSDCRCRQRQVIFQTKCPTMISFRAHAEHERDRKADQMV